jgi:hypothetical protein
MAQLPTLRILAPHVERRIHRALAADRAERDPKRTGKLGLSQIGGCIRNLWAGVHDVPEDAPIEPRMLVVFEHGNATESHLVALLRRAGFQVVDRDLDTGRQFEVVDHEGRVSGHLDGLILDASKSIDTWRLLEIKSANENQFEALLSAGYAAWQPKYNDQVQAYMGYARDQLKFGPIGEALVVVECKNDSRIYAERIPFDPMRFHMLRQKAGVALLSDVPPERPAEATSQYCNFCKWCPRNEWCWSSTADVRFAS